MPNDAQFPIGTRYASTGKHKHVCTVTDIHRTYNNAGELVRVEYVATHPFAGQTITEYHVLDTTIARNLITSEVL